MNIKSGDTVAIIAGKDKGKEGKVISAQPKDGRIVVEGINIQKRHTKPRSAQKPGGILEKAGPIDVSNAMVVCPKCKRPTRVANITSEEGKKYRACKHCGENLDKGIVRVKKDKDAAKAVPAKKSSAKKDNAKKETEEKPAVKKTAANKDSAAAGGKKPATKKSEKTDQPDNKAE